MHFEKSFSHSCAGICLEYYIQFFIRSHFYNLPTIEGEVFVVGDVPELVAEAAGGTDGFVDVAVGVAVDPVVDSAACDVVG